MIETYWDDYTSSEKEMFQRAIRRLLKNTFIVRDKDENSKKYYFFVSKKPEPISEYLSYIGFDIMVDRENGLIMLQNSTNDSVNSKRVQANRRFLNRIETTLLCCLWNLYSDRVATGSLKKIIDITIIELKMELEKYGIKEKINGKTLFKEALDTLKFYNLLDYENYGTTDCVIHLYSSIQFALNTEEFKKFAATAIEKTQRSILDNKHIKYSDMNGEVEEDGTEE